MTCPFCKIILIVPTRFLLAYDFHSHDFYLGLQYETGIPSCGVGLKSKKKVAGCPHACPPTCEAAIFTWKSLTSCNHQHCSFSWETHFPLIWEKVPKTEGKPCDARRPHTYTFKKKPEPPPTKPNQTKLKPALGDGTALQSQLLGSLRQEDQHFKAHLDNCTSKWKVKSSPEIP